ncbi:MAG: SDR family NAD(P)-dependent oxidoreductase [Pirellulales bacterium]
MQSWAGKVAIVTGASEGLGLSLARAWAERGAAVVLAARRAEPLQAAAESLANTAAPVLTVPTDVTRQEDVDRLAAATLEQFGRIDALVNNAGRSARQAIEDTTPADFQELWELNFLSVVRCTRACLPQLLERGGHVVNIGSLAGKIGARWIGAYPASKFPVSAYSQQLRLELGPRGLHVLLVSPGPIARQQPRERDEATLAALPESARRPGGGAKTRAIDPAWLAARVVQACDARRAELVVPSAARWLAAVGQLWPGMGDWLIRRAT